MNVHGLTLRNFRNIAEQTLPFSPGVNLILGDNGQGKTNLLEALYVLSHTRSHRTRQERELIMTGCSQAMVAATLQTRSGAGCELGARFSLKADGKADGETPRLKTAFLLNASPLRSRSALLGYAPTVSFFNTDLLLLRGAPDHRRHWLDSAIVQYDKRHFTYLDDYQRVRQQKARLLKACAEQGLSPAMGQTQLAVWNEQLARAGAQVIALRADYLHRLGELAAQTYACLSAGQEALVIRYRCHALADAPAQESPQTQEQWEHTLNEALARRAGDEWRRATCLVGPHRDDVAFALNELDACAYASQGQQRTVVLALKLAELALLSARLGDGPVLLLDDVMAELDPRRQGDLIDRLAPGLQVFLTTTHLDGRLREAVGRLMQACDTPAAAFHASGGVYTRISPDSVLHAEQAVFHHRRALADAV